MQYVQWALGWYVDALQKYAVFRGRAGRPAYWYFALVNILISMLMLWIDMRTGTFQPSVGMGLLGRVYTFAVMIPSAAVVVRRLHDTDRSGWWLLAGFVPIAGAILLIFFLVQPGTPGDNRFGPDPRTTIDV